MVQLVYPSVSSQRRPSLLLMPLQKNKIGIKQNKHDKGYGFFNTLLGVLSPGNVKNTVITEMRKMSNISADVSNTWAHACFFNLFL